MNLPLFPITNVWFHRKTYLFVRNIFLYSYRWIYHSYISCGWSRTNAYWLCVLSPILSSLFRLGALIHHLLLRLRSTTSKSRESRWPRDLDSVDESERRRKGKRKREKRRGGNKTEEGNMGKMKRVGGCRRKEGIIETSFYLSPLPPSLSLFQLSK